MLRVRKNLSFVLSLIVVAGVSVQGMGQADETAAAANSAYQQKDWATASRLYGELTQTNPNNRQYWYRLGVSEQAAGHHEQALHDFLQAQANGVPPAIVGFDMACAYSSMGQKDKAFETLTEAVKQGFGQPERMNSEPLLQPLKSDPRFAELLARATRNQKPCAYDAENRQFDFWVGDWDVVDASSGIAAGSSHVEKELGECVIWENWTSASTSYAGKSYNVYNPNLKQWEQFWVDNAGGTIYFRGGLKDGVMDFYTDEIAQSDGTKLKRHLQFFSLSPDKVRQYSQGSTDGGKTWRVEYDLTYTRKKSASNQGNKFPIQ